MASNNGDKILNVHTNLAVRLNPVFYQLPNESYQAWFYERFINLVSYRNSTLLPHLGHTCFFNVHKMDWHHKCILLHHYFSLIFPFALFQFVSFHQSEFFFCMSDNKTLSK